MSTLCLFQQKHFSYFFIFRVNHSVEIYPRGHRSTKIVLSVPDDSMFSRLTIPAQQGFDPLPADIIDLQAYLSRTLQGETYRRLRIEGVRIIIEPVPLHDLHDIILYRQGNIGQVWISIVSLVRLIHTPYLCKIPIYICISCIGIDHLDRSSALAHLA